MKVRLLTSLAGDTFSHACGAEVELDAAEAARLIERDLAVPVDATAAAAPPVAPAKPAQGKKRKKG